MSQRIAIVVSCYDRWEFLARTRPSWSRLPGPPSVFVGTYADDTIPGGFEDVDIVAARGEPFHRTRLLNCTASVARQSVDPEYLLFTDTDIEVLDPRLFDAALREVQPPADYVLDSPHAMSREFGMGNPDDPENTERGKRGTHLVRTRLFFELGGYDQRMVGWGLEDLNLYQRYREVSDRVAYFDRDGLVHLEHPDELRGKHNPGGVSHTVSMLKNLRKHMEMYDLYGESWADDFGYADLSVRPARSDR